MVGWGWWRGEEGLTEEQEETFRVMNVLTILSVIMVLQVCASFIIHQIAHFKYMQFIVCQFYLNKAFIIFLFF